MNFDTWNTVNVMPKANTHFIAKLKNKNEFIKVISLSDTGWLAIPNSNTQFWQEFKEEIDYWYDIESIGQNPVNTFNIKDFTNICKFISCRGFEEFAKMYEEIGFYGKSYAEEKYEKAIKNFSNWWCELDLFYQEKIINYVKKFYNN